MTSPSATSPDIPQPRIEAWFAAVTGAEHARISGLRRLTGGAIQHNWAFDVEASGGLLDGRHALVLRADAPSRLDASRSRADEFALLAVVWRLGVTVPEPLLLCDDPSVLGRPFGILRRLPGIAAGHQVVRDVAAAQSGEALAERLGEELARMHAMVPTGPAGHTELPMLGAPPSDPARARIAALRGDLDRLAEPRPALEWGLRLLERWAPAPHRVVLTHGDFRTGNYLVEAGRLSGVLDWEFAGWSDPLDDLGWLCARCWRFGRLDRRAGGIGSLEAVLRGYARVAGTTLPTAALPWWEALATARWAVIALQQGARVQGGNERGGSGLELALTGRMASELELDLVQQAEALRPKEPT